MVQKLYSQVKYVHAHVYVSFHVNRITCIVFTCEILVTCAYIFCCLFAYDSMFHVNVFSSENHTCWRVNLSHMKWCSAFDKFMFLWRYFHVVHVVFYTSGKIKKLQCRSLVVSQIQRMLTLS